MGVGLIRIIIPLPSLIKLALSQLFSPVSVAVLCFNKSQSVTGCQLLLIDPGKHISQLPKEPRLATLIGASEPSASRRLPEGASHIHMDTQTHGYTHTACNLLLWAVFELSTLGYFRNTMQDTWPKFMQGL